VAPLNAEIFARAWAQWYPDANPFGYELRWVYQNRWLRIHHLPLSKRWPETSAECKEVLVRQNTVATDVLGAAMSCWLLGYDYDGATTLPANHPLISLLSSAPILSLPPEDAESSPTTVFGGEVEWLPGRYDALLLAIAQDQLQALWIATDSGAVFAPYDGGADLIYPTALRRDAARLRYKAWLSAHPEGL